MKVATLLTIVGLLSLSGFSQQVQSTKLSDGYGKAAFLALKGIERDTSQTGAKYTRELIDSADAEAVSDEEKAMTATLNHIFADRTINNVFRSTVLLDYRLVATMGKNPDGLANDPKLKAIDQRESACFNPLEEILRARGTETPKACKSLLGSRQN